MSQSDSFIDEVTEEVRRDRLYAVFRRWGWVAVVLILAIVAGAAYVEWRKARDAAEAAAFGDAVLGAMAAGDEPARIAALDGVDAGPDGDGRRAVLAFLVASQDVAADRRPDAVKRLGAIADDAGLPPYWRALASLKRVILGAGTLSADERRTALDALAVAGQPFRPLALEQLALLDAEQGRSDAAITGLRAVLQEPQVSAEQRRRVGQMLVALGAAPAPDAAPPASPPASPPAIPTVEP